MSDFPSSAKCVVIGAGIVGNSLVRHLSDLGWNDIVLLDKGPLPNPGGSTGHASNFIFPVDHSKETVDLILDSQQQYEEFGLQTTCGGIEVARTPERMEELRRRMTSAKCWGIEARLLSAEEVCELVPFVNPDVILGGFHTPSTAVVNSVETGTQMRRRATEAGNLQTFGNTEVHDIETEPGPGGPRVSAVVTDRGRIATSTVVIACGVWSPKLAAMAGATIPLTPAVHQLAYVGPFDVLAKTGPGDRLPDRARYGHVSATSDSRRVRWRWVATPTVRSCTVWRRSHPTMKPCSPRRRCRSPPKTSTSSTSRPSSSWSSWTTARSTTPSTVCCR